MINKTDTRWIRLWRTWRGGRNTDTYVPIEYIGSDSKDSLRDAAESWAEDQLPGSDYSYGFEIVDQPRLKWIEGEIERCRRSINNHRQSIRRLQRLLPGAKP